jgi:hypothetical protein
MIHFSGHWGCGNVLIIPSHFPRSFNWSSVMARNRVVIDVEAVGCPWDSLSGEEIDYLAKRVARQRGLADWGDSEFEEAKQRLALSGLTGELAIIGMLNVDTGKGRLLFTPPSNSIVTASPIVPAFMEDIAAHTEGRVMGQVFSSEAMLLAGFWDALGTFDQIITYNGRNYDGPFLMHKSFLHGVPITRNLVPSRFDDSHIDLCDRLAFFGATRAVSLDFLCRRVGIPSPKQSMSGKDVEHEWRAGNCAAIGRYNVHDLIATARLFTRYAECFGLLEGMEPVEYIQFRS